MIANKEMSIESLMQKVNVVVLDYYEFETKIRNYS